MKRTLLLIGLGALAHSGIAAARPAQYRWPVSTAQVRVCAYRDGSGKDWNCGSNFYANHRGTDIAVGSGTPVFAAAPGKVNHRADGCPVGYVGSSCGGGFGNHVSLFHGGGDESIYGHFLAGSGVAALGDIKGCGDAIGQSGSSGSSSGAHLHFETRTGVSEASYYSGVSAEPFQGQCNNAASFWTVQGSGYATCRAAASNPETHLTCGGPTCEGLGTEWQCDGAARKRCASGQVQTEPCPLGCEARPGDDVCKANSCPAGLTATWECGSEAERRRCVGGQPVFEPCPLGCEPGADGADATCRTTPACPEGQSEVWVCTHDGGERTRCVDGQVEAEACELGCNQGAPGEDATCREACGGSLGANWTCTPGKDGRERCVAGAHDREPCTLGCTQGPDGQARCEVTAAGEACSHGELAQWTCDATLQARVRCERGVVVREVCDGRCIPSERLAEDKCGAPDVGGGCAQGGGVQGAAVLGWLGLGWLRRRSARR